MPCGLLSEVQRLEQSVGHSDVCGASTAPPLPSSKRGELGDVGSDLVSEELSSSTRHPLHLLTRLPSFHSYVVGGGDCDGAGGGKATSDPPARPTVQVRDPASGVVGLETSAETCCVVAHTEAFAKRTALQQADDKDTVSRIDSRSTDDVLSLIHI